MGDNQTSPTTASLNRPLLGDLTFDDPIQKSALGGLNPHSPHFVTIANQFLHLMISNGLRPTSKFLDVGCGTGRLTKAVSNYLTKGKYVGYDINQRFIDYCQTTYQATNIQFIHNDIKHDEYNPNGQIDPVQMSLPFLNGSFDYVAAIAVINHLHLEWAIRLIAEMARVTKRSGICFITAFLLQPKSIIYLDKEQKRPFKFDLRTDNEWYDKADRKLINVAFPELPIRRAFMKSGLTLQEPIRYGQWGGGRSSVGHDILIGTKSSVE